MDRTIKLALTTCRDFMQFLDFECTGNINFELSDQ